MEGQRERERNHIRHGDRPLAFSIAHALLGIVKVVVVVAAGVPIVAVWLLGVGSVWVDARLLAP